MVNMSKMKILSCRCSLFIEYLLVRRDESPENYCHSPAASLLSSSVDKNFNLDHNLWTATDRTFIFHMCIPCDKTFHIIP